MIVEEYLLSKGDFVLPFKIEINESSNSLLVWYTSSNGKDYLDLDEFPIIDEEHRKFLNTISSVNLKEYVFKLNEGESRIISEDYNILLLKRTDYDKEQKTSIQITSKTKKDLIKLKKENDTYDTVVQRLLRAYNACVKSSKDDWVNVSHYTTNNLLCDWDLNVGDIIETTVSDCFINVSTGQFVGKPDPSDCIAELDLELVKIIPPSDNVPFVKVWRVLGVNRKRTYDEFCRE